MMMILFIFVDSYFIVTSKIQNTQNIRESLITDTVEAQHKGEWDYNNVLILPKFAPGQLYADASPQNFYDPIHYQSFLAYYKLDLETLVWFGDSYDKLIAILDKDNGMKLTVSEFVMADGCGNQQEFYYLEQPYLIMRTEIEENSEGPDWNAVCFKGDYKVVDDFVSHYKEYKKERIVPRVLPSNIIMDAIDEYCGRAKKSSPE